ncbi:MAG: hypothetical protein LBR91_02100 [Puniceicoccales bacterium]|jgi:lipopolysaccharide biosynthesis glycosyltransferase|nr:hypothetical protein [Puniceicoccales bacterium]
MTPLIETNKCRYFLVSSNINLAICYKLFVGSVFKNYKKIVYLDADTIVCEDIANLFNIDLRGKAIGSVMDSCLVGELHAKRTEHATETEKHFNSEIMLMDVGSIRKKKYEKQFIEIVGEGEKMSHDQDAINTAMQRDGYGDVLHIDSGWNCSPGNKGNHSSAKIIHYRGGCNKPWFYKCDLAEHWWKYARMTPFYENILFERIAIETQRAAKKTLHGIKISTPHNRLLYFGRYLLYKLLGRIFPIAKYRRKFRQKAQQRATAPQVAYFKYLRYSVFGTIFPVATRRTRYRQKAAQYKQYFKCIGN